MQSAQSSDPILDYSFPWSMGEEDKAQAASPGYDLGGRGLFEIPKATETLPIAFRTWVLEHFDELEKPR